MAARVMAVPRVLLILLLLLAAEAVRPARDKAAAAAAAAAANKKVKEYENTPKRTGVFFTNRDQYSVLANRMKNNARGEKEVAGHPLLYTQRGNHKLPPFYMEETLHGEGKDRTKLHVRGDNLYLACFTNGDGQIFCFNDADYNTYAIPNAIILPFGPGYGDLVGDGEGGEAWRKLEGLELSRGAVNRAIKVVSSYYRGMNTAEQIKELKRALATLIVFVCESARFPYIRQLVERAFLGSKKEDKLDHRGAQLVVQWKRISCAILIWNMDKKRWDSAEAIELYVERPDGPGIATIEEALANIGPILRVKQCSVVYEV